MGMCKFCKNEFGKFQLAPHIIHCDMNPKFESKMKTKNGLKCRNCNKYLVYRQEFYCSKRCQIIYQQTGKPLSENHKLKLSLVKKGKPSKLKGIPFTQEHKNNLSNSLKGRELSEETKLRISLKTKEAMNRPEIKLKIKNQIRPSGVNSPLYGRKASLETRQTLRVAHLGIKQSEESKRKKRVSLLKYIENHKGKPFAFTGKHEKQLLDLQEQKDNCKILRQYHLKDLGYIVDGYCKETNTVYEVYEPYHDKTIFRDLDRETEICNKLSSDFIIIWDR
jgi:endogenous inhibitor of DNA gyrase (YacG/DUF329 family)